MPNPREMSNDVLALHIELWTELEHDLTEGQKEFFTEVVWRLRLMADKEQEKVDE